MNVIIEIKTVWFPHPQVQDSGDVITEGRIRVVFSIPCEPNLDALIQNQHVSTIVGVV